MSSIAFLPPELLLYHLLPPLRARDILSLGRTNKHFHVLCDDETVWKQKCNEDFNFSGLGTIRTTEWKRIYKGLTKPKAYVWGSRGQGRLGLDSRTLTHRRNVCSPTLLTFPSRTIVHLDAGGWSFNALDHTGRLQVCGTLDAQSYRVGHRGYPNAFAYPSTMIETPRSVQMPCRFRSISCGRKHLMALDTSGHVWTFKSWSQPFRLNSPLLDHTFDESTVVQIESGWTFCSVLTASGDVYVWWPYNDPVRAQVNARMDEIDQEEGRHAVTEEGALPTATWDFEYDPLRLPSLLALPELRHPEEDGESSNSAVKLVKIAGMDNALVGLTNKGHVLYFGNLGNETSAQGSRWKYLPYFSEVDKVRTNQAFERRAHNDSRLAVPTRLRITHITGHFRRFAAYSTGAESIVLIGTNAISPQTQPTIIPELQYKSVISVVMGDWHFAALTADGKMYTWGSYSDGALGLGDVGRHEGRVDVPTQVEFEGEEKFCFAIAAGGHHTGALVLDI